MNIIEALAKSFVETDPSAIRDDVSRLSSIREAADYSASMAAGQPDWEALDSQEGRVFLGRAITDAVVGQKVTSGDGEDTDTGRVDGIEAATATVSWNSGVVTKSPLKSLTFI